MARGIVLGIRPFGLHTVLVMNRMADPVAHVEAARELGVGLQVRAGLHTGECERGLFD